MRAGAGVLLGSSRFDDSEVTLRRGVLTSEVRDRPSWRARQPSEAPGLHSSGAGAVVGPSLTQIGGLVIKPGRLSAQAGHTSPWCVGASPGIF